MTSVYGMIDTYELKGVRYKQNTWSLARSVLFLSNPKSKKQKAQKIEQGIPKRISPSKLRDQNQEAKLTITKQRGDCVYIYILCMYVYRGKL